MKRNLREVLVVVFLVLLTLFPMVSRQGEAAEATKEPIKIGHINTMTGAYAAFGEDSLHAVKIAVAEINSKGGILGRPLEVVSRDDMANPEKGLEAAKNLILAEHVDYIVGTTSSAVAAAISQFVKIQKVPYIITSAQAEDLTGKKGHRYIFRFNTNTNMYIYSDIQVAAKLPIKKWWLLNADYEYGHECYNKFTQELKKLKPDVQFVGESWPKLGTTDWMPYLAPIMASDAEGLFLTVIITKGLKTAGLYKKVTILGHDWGNIILLYPAREFIEDGMWGGTQYPFWLLKDNPQSAYLVREYMKDRANPPGSGAAGAYAFVSALATAAKATGSTDKEKIIDFLEGRTLDTLVGPVTIQAFDHQAQWPFWFGRTKTTPEYPSFPILVDTTKYQKEGYRTKEEVLQARGMK